MKVLPVKYFTDDNVWWIFLNESIVGAGLARCTEQATTCRTAESGQLGFRPAGSSFVILTKTGQFLANSSNHFVGPKIQFYVRQTAVFDTFCWVN